MHSLTKWIKSLVAAICLIAPGAVRLRAEDDAKAQPSVQMKLGGCKATTQKIVFTVGHATMDFTGQWAPVLQNGKPIGFFLEGAGSLSYASTFEPEWPVLTRNVKAWTTTQAETKEASRVVNVAFKKARLYVAGPTLPSWNGEASAPLDTDFQTFDQRWGKVDSHTPLHLITAQAADGRGESVAVLEMEEESHRFIYLFDPLTTHEETLSTVLPYKNVPVSFMDWSYILPLSRQYLGWDPKKGTVPAAFQLTDLDVDLRTADNRNAEVVVRETIVPLKDGISVFEFEFISDIITVSDTRAIRIASITDESGRALEFNHAHDRLCVRTNAPGKRGTPMTLKFEYKGDFLVQPRSDNFWQLGVRAGWYPTPRDYASESYLFHGTVRTKGDWTAFLPGETVQRGRDGEWNLVETRTTKPICFSTILGGKYGVQEESRNGLTVRIATYGFKPGVSAKVFRDQAFNIIAYYQQFLGAFPFKEFTIIEKNEWGYGQAPPGMMYITRDAFEQIQTITQMQDIANTAQRYGAKLSFNTMDVRHVFAHEIAHQYWGTVVKMPAPHDQWLTESFADYCAALYERDFKGKGYFDKNIARWKAGTDRSGDKGPIPLANDLHLKDGIEAFYARTDLLYAKGPLLLAALHQELGDQAFLTWLKSTQTNFRWKFASTQRIFDLLQFITKKDYTEFINDKFWGLGTVKVNP